MPASCLNCSPASREEGSELPKRSFPGFALACDTNSRRSFAGTEGVTTMTHGERAIRVIGVTSATGSNGMLACRLALMTWAATTTTRLWPSGADFRTTSVPVMPFAPARFSTKTFWPQASASFCASCRLMMSVPPPGAYGTTIRTGFAGNCALAAVVDLGCLPDEQPRSLGTRRHLAQLELNRLVLADRLAEGVPLLRIPDRLVERRLGDADPPRRDVDPSELEPADRLLEAAAFVADQVLLGHAVVLEHQLR